MFLVELIQGFNELIHNKTLGTAAPAHLFLVLRMLVVILLHTTNRTVTIIIIIFIICFDCVTNFFEISKLLFVKNKSKHCVESLT